MTSAPQHQCPGDRQVRRQGQVTLKVWGRVCSPNMSPQRMGLQPGSQCASFPGCAQCNNRAGEFTGPPCTAPSSPRSRRG